MNLEVARADAGNPAQPVYQQIADQILYLASERGKAISGQAISVCGDTQMLA